MVSNQDLGGMKTVKQLTIRDIQLMKDRGEKIVAASANDYNTAQIVEEAGVDLICLGGAISTMIIGGEPNTFGATMEDIIFMLSRVAPAVKHAVLMGSMPYGGYQESNEQAIHNAVRLIKAGAHFTKMQGATSTIIERIKSTIDVGIPVEGHIGMTPHYLREIGGFKTIGKTAEEALKIYRNAKELEEAGVWAIEMECVPDRIAAEITKKTKIPIIGIGSGKGTDGQTLALQDILGLQKTIKPKHSKCYIDLWSLSIGALKDYIKEVKENVFPSEENTFKISDEEFEKFLDNL